VAASNLDVATFQVTYQMKILTTAFFSVIMLRKRLSASKWLALLLLAVGVGIVQIQTGNAGHGTVAHSAVPTSVSDAVNSIHEHAQGLHERNDVPIPGVVPDLTEDTAPLALEEIQHVSGHEMHRLTGFAAVSAACMTSGLAGVYFEMVLKGSKADLWTRNVQLSMFSLIPALMPVLFQSAGAGGSGGLFGILLGPFRNFSLWAWGTVLTQVFGGLITALVIKYSDNILKGFATSLSIVISFLASVGLFAYPITPAFVLGSSIVLAATWMYNQPADTARVAAASVNSASGYGRVSLVDQDGTVSRINVAVPGSPIPADAPIIGETPKPSRASSFVSLLGLTSATSRSQTPSVGMQHSPDYNAQAHVNGMYSTAPSTPQVNSSTSDLFSPPSSQSVADQQYGYARGPHHGGHSGNGISAAPTTTSGGTASPVKSKASVRPFSHDDGR
jgi:UDP-sugar transporter A1/2/3